MFIRHADGGEVPPPGVFLGGTGRGWDRRGHPVLAEKGKRCKTRFLEIFNAFGRGGGECSYPLGRQSVREPQPKARKRAQVEVEASTGELEEEDPEWDDTVTQLHLEQEDPPPPLPNSMPTEHNAGEYRVWSEEGKWRAE